MSTYHAQWGETGDGGEVAISTAGELDALLDRITVTTDTDGYPFKVGIFADGIRYDSLPVGVEITTGHPERSSVLYLGPGGSGLGFDDALPVWEGGTVWFNTNGVPADYEADRLRLRPEQARQAVREFVLTGQRPTCARWETMVGVADDDTE